MALSPVVDDRVFGKYRPLSPDRAILWAKDRRRKKGKKGKIKKLKKPCGPKIFKHTET